MGLDFLYSDDVEDLDDEQNLLFLQWSQYIRSEYHKELLDLIVNQGKCGYAINNGQYYKKDNAWRSSENFELNAYVLATHPETFCKLKEKNIGVWHGSNGNGIASILKHGLVASAFHSENGIVADFGEKEITKDVYWGGVKSFISASADLRVAMKYAALNLEGGDTRETSFPVIYGLTDADCSELGGLSAYSDISEEIRLNTKNVPPEKIKFIGVPPEKVDYVRMLVGNREIEVGALDLPLNKRGIERLSLLEILKRGSSLTAECGSQKIVPIEKPDLKALAKTRIIDRIRKVYNDLKKRIAARWQERGDRGDETGNER